MRWDYITLNLTKIAGFILLGVLAHKGQISWLMFFTVACLMSDVKFTYRR
jgi:hypothetical protein